MRSRLIAVLIVPTLTIVVLATVVMRQGDERYREADQHRSLAGIAQLLATLDRDLGEEALESAIYASSRQKADPTVGVLFASRFRTNTSLVLLEQEAEAAGHLVPALRSALENVRETTLYRSDIEDGLISPLQISDRYSFVRRQLLDAIAGDATAHRVRGDELPELISLINVRSAHLNERLVVQLAINFGQWAPAQRRLVIHTLSEQALYLREAGFVIQNRLKPSHPLTSIRNRIELADDVPSITEQRWLDLSDQWLAALHNEIEVSSRHIVAERVLDAERASSNRTRTLGLVLSSITAGILLALFVSVRLVRRLMRITGIAERASEIAGFEELDPANRINDESRDEIGRLSRAFDTMTSRLRDAAERQRDESRVLEMIVRSEPIDRILEASARLLGEGAVGEPLYQFVTVAEQEHAKSARSRSSAPGRPGDSQIALVSLTAETLTPAPASSAGVAVGLAEMAHRRAVDDAEMAHRASRDALTGLFNRRSILEHAQRLLDQADASGSGEVRGALLYLDLDGFKIINDEQGHGAGDTALVNQARRMEQFARLSVGAAGRFGGDEFLMVLEEVVTEADLASAAAELAADLLEPMSIDDGIVVNVGASIGGALIRPGIALDEVLHEADTALYASKVAGASLPVISTERFRSEITERENLAAAFRLALDRNEFVLWYQPIWGRGGRELVGLEALARWERPDAGLVFPDVFLPVAESLNLMAELDANLFERACEQLAAWGRQGLDVPSLSVNVAPPRLESDDFVSSTLQAIQDHGCSPSQITLEVTEQLFMQQMEVTCARLAELRDAGLQVAIDDFGQGYSSLAYLQRLPVDVLKIDREFVSGIDTSATKEAIVSAVNELAIAMELEVVAEGVEREEELVRLDAIGCSMVQGYLLARPMPVEKLEVLLGEREVREAASSVTMPGESATWFDPAIPDRIPADFTQNLLSESAVPEAL